MLRKQEKDFNFFLKKKLAIPFGCLKIVSMSDTYQYNNSVTLEKLLCNLINGINKVVPIQKIDQVSCFYNWLDSVNKLNTLGLDYIQADYYNGSDSELNNIFLEILALATTDHCFNGQYVLKRLEFLANEGLHLVKIEEANKNSFKLTPDECNSIIHSSLKPKKVTKKQVKKNLNEAVSNYKKSVKSSVGLKSIKKKPLKRDKKGRFIKNK